MNLGVQIVSFTVMLTIAVIFFSNKHIKLLSTRIYTLYLSVSLLYSVFEGCTIYTLYHIDRIDPFINRLAHQLFIGSLVLILMFLFIYIDILTRKQKRYKPIELIISILPALLSLVMTAFGEIDYHIGSDGRYSSGSVVMVLYGCLAVYALWTIITVIRRRKSVPSHIMFTALCGISGWIIIGIVQIFNPTWLIESMGVSLMQLFIFLSVENPREYNDMDISGALNRHAFEMMLKERCENGKGFFVVTFTLANSELLKNSVGVNEVYNILGWAALKLSTVLRSDHYHTSDNSISFIVKHKACCEKLIKSDFDKVEFSTSAGVRVNTSFRLSFIECPKYADSVEKITELMTHILGAKMKSDRSILVVSEAVIDEINYLSGVERLLQYAVKNDGLEVFYQPIYSTTKKKFVSAEALVRLKDRETLGFISPEIFIPMAERMGLISDLGNIVFENVCRFAQQSNIKQYGVEYIEVNISAVQSVDISLPDRLLDCMSKYGITSDFFNLEITETAAVEAGELLDLNMSRLKTMGCGFSMDDFGTGYSNLSQMANTGFDIIKLDKSLIWPCFDENGEKPRTILDSCIAMINGLGIAIVAEGVETKEQVDLLTSKGVEYLQGYYFAKPMNERDYLNFMQNNC
mgnify:FL=1